MADDQPQATSSATPVSPADSEPKVIPQEESAATDTNRPLSTIPADSQNQPETLPADSPSDYTVPRPLIPAESQEATQSANINTPTEMPSVVPNQQPESSARASLADSQKHPPAEPLVQPTEELVIAKPAPPPAQTEPSEPSQPSSPSTPSNPPEPVSGGSIQDLPSSDQPSQVQPEPQEVAPSPPPSEEPKTASESAEIKPEPPQSTQDAPLADSKAEKTAKTTFGDLAGEPRAPSPKPVTPPISPITPSPSSPSQPSDDKLKAETETRRQKATQIRKQKREANLAKALGFVGQKGKINNRDVRDLLHISQTTATEYLHSLVKDGKLKKEGKGKATKYFL